MQGQAGLGHDNDQDAEWQGMPQGAGTCGVSPGRAREAPHGSNLNICLTLKEFYSVKLL